MNTVLSLIVMVCQNTLKDDVMYTIAQYILEHVYDLREMNIKSFSENAYVSTTSIIKFCQMLGFNSYSEFKNQFLATLQMRGMQLSEKNRLLTMDILFSQLESLTNDHIDKEKLFKQIDEIVQHIHEDKSLHLFGATFPLALAQSFIEDMAVMHIPVYVHQNHFGENDFTRCEKGVWLIMTLSGRYIESNRNEYHQLCSMNQQTILISRKIENIGDVAMNIALPHTISVHFDEFIFLILLDMIQLRYYQKLY